MQLDEIFAPAGYSFLARSDRDDVERWLGMPAQAQMPAGGLDVDEIKVAIAQDHNRTDRAKRFKCAVLNASIEAFKLTDEEAAELTDAMFEAMNQTSRSFTDFCYGKHWRWLFRSTTSTFSKINPALQCLADLIAMSYRCAARVLGEGETGPRGVRTYHVYFDTDRKEHPKLPQKKSGHLIIRTDDPSV